MLLRVLIASSVGCASLAAALFIGCSDDTAAGGGGSGPDLEDVIYEGGTTDEALEALVAAEPKDEAAKQAIFTWPEPGAAISPVEPFTFCWHIGPVAERDRTPSAVRLGSRLPEPAQPTLARPLLEKLLSGVRPAYAHGTPINGPAYFLVISSESEPNLVRVFTNTVDYTPATAVWDTIKQAGTGGTALTAKVIWADFETNRVAQDGGPWDGKPVTFTIAAE